MLNRTNLARIDLNLLVLFEAVLEERHVGRAAARLHVSPSAVSHGLNRLQLMKIAACGSRRASRPPNARGYWRRRLPRFSSAPARLSNARRLSTRAALCAAS
jgi:hypothetical protein